MTISIHASAFDVNSWYQKITLTFINESGNAVDMNHAAISFTASGTSTHGEIAAVRSKGTCRLR